jgi:hypothetical protein
MTLTVDSHAPLASLETQGIPCKVSHTTSSSSFGIRGVRIPISATVGTRYRFLVPQPPAVKVSFVPEKVRHKVIKVFKRELQLGDPEFDAAVYIDTDEEARVAAFLEAESTRSLVLEVVGGGGQIAIGDEKIQVVFAGSDRSESDAQLMAAMLVAAAINFQYLPQP